MTEETARPMAALARSAMLVVALLIAGLAPPTPSHAQTAPAAAAAGQPQGVVIRGNRRIESDTILAYMGLQPGQQVTAEALNRSVRSLFDTGLFRNVVIVPTDQGLVVEVEENPSINVIAFEGNDALKDEDLEQIISLRPRLPFTVSAAEADAQAIIEVYRRTGRYGAEVEPVIIERSDNRVDLVFEISEGELTGVSSIDFIGNKVFSDRRLRGVIETRESGLFAAFFSTDVYDPNRLELDKELLRQFYFEQGYADFTVLSATAELAPDRQGFYIAFTVDEGEQYAFGDLDVDVQTRGLNPADFEALIPDDLTGETYDAGKVDEIANQLTDYASSRGYAFVQVRPRPRKNADDRTVAITFEVAEGPRVFIERIEIEGNTATLDRVIRREIELVEGDAFDARKIREAEREIRALGYFNRVEIDTVQGSAEDRAVLNVKLEEKSTGALTFGIGYSGSDGPVGNIQMIERNFLGRGQVVRAQLTAAGDTQVYDVAFTEPKFLDRDLSITMRAFFIDEDLSDQASFQIARIGVAPQVSFPIDPDTRLGLRYEFLREDLQADPTASPVITRDDGVSYTSRVGYTLTHDKRNDVIEPTSGYLMTWDQDFAGLGGDARYFSQTWTGKGWTSFLDDDIVASLEVELSAIYSFSQDVRVNERFFLGGASLRGFQSQTVGPRDTTTGDSLGGNYRVVSRLEVSFPIGLPEELGVFGGLFVDAGTVFGIDGNPVDLNGNPIDDDAKLRVGAGGLLFLATPFGPLELSFGFPVVKEDGDESELFRLQVGTRF